MSTPAELVHQGVKGMKWGVHKSGEPVSVHSSYTPYHQRTDAGDFGQRGANRINNRLHAGQTHTEARAAELSRQNKQRAAFVGALITARILLKYGPVAVQTITVKAHNNRVEGQRQGTINYNTPRAAKQNKQGVHNVTSK